MSERNEELDKILDKAFADLKKKVYRLMEKNEKRALREAKNAGKEKHTHTKRNPKKSESSSSDSE